MWVLECKLGLLFGEYKLFNKRKAFDDVKLTLTCIVKNCLRKFSKFLAEFANSIIELIFLKQNEQINLGRLSFSLI